MVVDGATALHIAADNGNLDVGTLEHPWLLVSSILLRRCIYDTFINFMQTMHFIHAAKYHLTDVPGSKISSGEASCSICNSNLTELCGRCEKCNDFVCV